MTRKLRYSERKTVAEKGTLGSLDDVPNPQLQAALIHLIRQGEESKTGFTPALRDAVIRHFGLTPVEASPTAIISNRSTDDFLDFIEIVCEIASEKFEVYSASLGGRTRYARPVPSIESEINDLFDRHRFGYRLESGEIRKVGSPALDEEVVGPALLAIQREGWGEVERSFKEAIHHQRGPQSENDDALTSANAAVEAALKAAGFKGANLGPLAKDFQKSLSVPTELKMVPEALNTLIGRSGALRSSHGDAHGKAPGAAPVPQALVDLAIHWAGAFIVYLSNVVSDEE